MPISQQLAKREETPVLQGRIDWAHRHFTSLKSMAAARWAGLRDTCEAGVEQSCPFLTFLPLLLCPGTH